MKLTQFAADSDERGRFVVSVAPGWSYSVRAVHAKIGRTSRPTQVEVGDETESQVELVLDRK